ncbi:ABC transporter ATP-binding protein [Bradyrhizobium sp.]|uniref:ABC transporter ATP-binding protein n=1 Tax=Bradyrhizobium sp. TaxID=376 RepID=UPI0039E64D98
MNASDQVLHQAVLSIENLKVSLPSDGRPLQPVRGVSLEVRAGRTLCIVGESGCGKSMTAMGIMKLLPESASISADRIDLAGQDLSKLDEKQFRELRGDRIAMIFQDPMTCLNPVLTVGEQMTEVYLRHRRATKAQARTRAIELLEQVGVTSANRRLAQYPHELSGGLRQRVMIAIALMCDPKVLIADEPTTALDVTVQLQILRLLREIQQRTGLAIVLITHDLGVVAHVAHDVVVMYAGEIVERGTLQSVFANPLHPYTRGLMDCIPVPGKIERGSKLNSIPGLVPSLRELIVGCGFRQRCRFAREACSDPVALREVQEGRWVRCILEEQDLS